MAGKVYSLFFEMWVGAKEGVSLEMRGSIPFTNYVSICM